MNLLHRLGFLAATSLVTASLVAVTTLPASAASDYWTDGASAACSNTGPGTQATPFCTISAAAKLAVNPGDTVHIEPATYREQVTVAGSGTAGSPITFQGEAPGVVISGTQSLSDAAGWTPTATTAWSRAYAPPSAPKLVLVDGTPLTVASSATTTVANSWFYDTVAKILYVDLGGANPGDGHQVEAGAQSFGITMTGRSNVVVRNVETRSQNFAGVRALTSSAVVIDQVTASGSASNGILVDTSQTVSVSRATVSGCLSTGIRLSASTGGSVTDSTSHDNGLDGIGLTTSTQNTISGNTTYANVSRSPTATGVGIDVNTTSSDNDVLGNVSYGNQDSGFQVYNGSHNVLVARNISYNNGDHGFDTLSATGAQYLNNTSYNNRRDGISVEGSSTGATVANNLLVDNGTSVGEYDLYVDPGSVTGLTSDYDVAYNHATAAPVKFNGTVYPTFAAFQTATGLEPHGASYAPGFVNAGAANFALQGGSAAVDSANAGVTGFVSTDPRGNVPTDDPIVPDTGAGSPSYADRGALEFQPSGSPTDYAPHAALFLDPPTVSVPPGTAIAADARGSNDADLHGIASYSFDFGDGTVVGPQASGTATHAYASPGTYHVQVTVTDTAGLTDSATADEVVSARTLQTYYVSQGAGCTDTGAGTQSTPFCSIGAATKKAVAGDSILVAPGSYREQVQPTVSGQSGAPITITGAGPSSVILGSNDLSDAAGWSSTSTNAWKHAYSPVTAPAQVWLDGAPLTLATGPGSTTPGSWYFDAAAGQLYVDIGGGNPATGHTVAAAARNFGLLLRNVGDYVVSGFSVTQTNLAAVYLDTTSRVTLSHISASQAGTYGVTVDSSAQADLSDITSSNNLSIGVRLFQSTNSSLSSSTTHDNQFHGVSVQGGQGNTITGVTSYANKKPGTRVADGIDVSQSAVGTVVQRCTSYGNDDSGMESFTGSSGTVFRRNLSYDNGDHGIDNSGAPNSVVVSNTVVGNATAGINFEGSSTGALSRDNVTMDNAVGSTRTVGEIRVDASSTPGTTIDRDLVFKSAAGVIVEWAGTNYTTLSEAVTATGQEAHGLGGDPLFVNATGRDLRLSGDSPALDAAYTAFAAWSAPDLNGNAPIDDPAVTDTGNGPDAFADLGALEYGGPVARGSVTPTSGTAPLDVAVDGSASSSLGPAITGYTWSCGNGTTINGQSGTCHYGQGGTYTVRLTVTAGGATDTWSVTVTVTADAPPVAALKSTPTTLYANQTATLDASGSTDTDATPIATYTFSCGNGTASQVRTTPTATCPYTKSGSYTASVTVTDTAGLSSLKSVTVKVLADVAPTAVLSLSSTKISRGGSVTANGSASSDPDTTPVATYRFDCGNGHTTTNQASPTTTCTYTTTGSFTVRMWVTDTAGHVSSTTKKVQVK